MELLTTPEVAKILRVSERTVENYVKKGVLRPIALPGAVRFDPRDIEALIGTKREEENDAVA